MSISYVVEVQENQDGDLFIVLPDEVIEELGWEENDLLSWDVKGDGIILSDRKSTRLNSSHRT